MRLTRLGWGCAAMAALALMTAGATGNNLLYLLYSALTCALLVSALAGRLNLARVLAQAEVPDQLFRGGDFPLMLRLSNPGRWAAHAVSAALGESRRAAPLIEAKGSVILELPARAEHRGCNRIEGLALESLYPWGLLRHRRALEAVRALALPRLSEVHGAGEVRAEARASGRPTLRKGSGDELFGIRGYDPSDDVRKINWKLSARSGRALVNEYCEPHDSKITVTVQSARGEDAERRIEDAASACRFYIDSGAQVRLVTPEEELDYGKGLLHLDRLLRSLSLLGEGKTERVSRAGAAARAGRGEDGAWDALRRLTWAGGALVYAAMFLVDDVNAKSWLLALPVLPLGWLVQERGLRLLPEPLWTAAGLAIVGLWTRYFFTARVVDGTLYVLMYLLINRLLHAFEREGLPTIFLIYALGFLLVSGLTISPWYFAFFVGYLAFGAVWLALSAGASWKARRAWLAGLSGWLAAALALTGALFTLTPRSERRQFSPFLSALNKFQARASSVSGFTENVSLGWFGELKRSSARVMRVRPLSPAAARPGLLRVRGAAYDVFDGRTWKKELVDFSYFRGERTATSTGGRAWAQKREGTLRLAAPPQGEASLSPAYEFAVYPLGISVLFTVGTPWFVEGINDAAYFDYTDSLYVSAPYLSGLRYRVYASAGREGPKVGLASMDEGLRRRYLDAGPDPSGQIAALAEKAAGSAAGEEEKARAIESYLRRHYSYSMYSDNRGLTLPGFLFASRKGNCEYFATAGVILMRRAGVPARLVTGFLAEDWNEFGGFYDVRQRSAHAWVEAYLPGRGWTSFDPTPAQSALSASADAFSRRMERWMDAFQGEWYRSVIGYDQFAQTNTFHKIGVAFSLGGLFAGLRSAVLVSLAAAAAWLAALLLARGLRRLKASRSLGPYARAEQLLFRAGLARPPHLTPREYAAWLAGRRPDLAELAPLAELYYLQRYAGLAPSAAERGEAERLLKSLGGRL